MSLETARAALEEGRYADALIEYHILLSTNPGDATFHLGAARCLAGLDRLPEAAAALRKALSRNPALREAATEDPLLRDLFDADGKIVDTPSLLAGSQVQCPACAGLNPPHTLKCAFCNTRLQAPDSELVFPEQHRYSNPLWLAIICVFCCLPTAIVAIVYAAQAMTHASNGNMDLAENAAGTSWTWCWISIGLGILALLLQAANS